MTYECFLYCLISLVFLFGMIFTMWGCRDVKNNFLNILSKEQLHIYNQIVEMRLSIWFRGLVLGIILGLIVMYIIKQNNKMNNYVWTGCCIFTAIALATNYFYYMLAPKPLYMVDFLKDMKQVKEWYNVYLCMSYRYHLGMFLSIPFYLFFYRMFS